MAGRAVAVALVMLMILIPATLIAVTPLGNHVRGRSNAVAFVSGVAFPIPWTAWYLLDTHPGCSPRRLTP
jgi:hypothetical protein